MPTPEFAVVTEGLTKRFGDLVAVDAIDLRVEAGTVMSLLGPNGAGKTTTVRMLATLSAPTSGSASVCGYDIVQQADAVRRVISLTGQFAALEDNLTARENLLLMARLRGYGRAAAVKIVDSLIDRFDIGEFRDKLDQGGVGRPAPAGRPGRQSRRPARAAGARRADHRTRSPQPSGGVVDRARPGRRGRHPPAHHPEPGGGRCPGRQHRADRPRPGRGRRHPERPEGTDRRPAGRCGGRRRPRPRGAWSTPCRAPSS